MSGILGGVRIIEGSAFVAAPVGGLTLAQLGADVIRFDQIGGGLDYHRWPVTKDNRSLFWASLNRGKRSIAVDIRDKECQEIVTQLICSPGDEAGMFLSNFPERNWLSYQRLRKRRDDLIYINITGDRHGRSAVDYTVNAETGIPFMTGSDDSPVNQVLPAWDHLTGQVAVVSLLAAERYRRLNGAGQLVRLALKDVALATMSHNGFIAEASLQEAPRKAYGNYLYGAFGRDFVTADGVRIMIVALTQRQWVSLKRAIAADKDLSQLERSLELDLDREGDRFLAREEIAGIVENWTKGRQFADVAERFDATKVRWSKYRTTQQMLREDPECSPRNPMFQMVNQKEFGTFLAAGLPADFSAVGRQSVGFAPRLGEHTDEILADIVGLSSAAIGRLHDRRVIAGAVS